MKFGGALIADGEGMMRVAEIVRSFQEGNDVCVVVSALQGITDSIEENARMVCGSGDDAIIYRIIKYLGERHHDVAETAIKDDEIRKGVISEIDERLDEMEKALIGIYHLGELTDRSLDYITSFGERLSAPILTGVLRSAGVNSLYLTGGEAGITTDDKYRNARPLETSEEGVKTCITTLLRDQVPVIAGYIGSNRDGIITTLGRGGSDYTATIIGAGISADEIWLWKNTKGIMSANPKIIAEAKRIPEMSYTEAMELSYFGAEILHPSALEPVIMKRIPVRIKDISDPLGGGTIIVYETKETEDVVKAITLIEDVALINVSGMRIVGKPGTAGRIFSALGENDVNIMMISQGSSERAISIVVDRLDLENAIRSLKMISNGVNVVYDNGISVIAVVGAGMAGTPGVAGRIFSALGRSGVNIMMISQGSSEYNISLVVKKCDSHRAVRAIHDEFME